MKLEELARAVAKAERDADLSTSSSFDDLEDGAQQFLTRIAADTLRALLAVLPSFGWQIVPVEPTWGVKAMSGAGADNLPCVEETCGRAGAIAVRVYKAMLAAAPKPED